MVRLAFQVIKNQETPNIVCSFDNFRYIFNIPEGFQRYLKDNGMKINPAPKIFFTRNNTETLLGCFGYLHTLLAQNCGVGTKLYGPKGLYNLFNMKRYNEIGGFKMLPYSFQEINGKLLLGTKDTSLIEELLQQNDCLLQEFLEKIKEFQIDPQQSNNASCYMKTSNQFQDENLLIQCIETGDNIQYIIQSPQLQGNISKEKLAQYKIPGNKMSQLMKQGKVILENQQTILLEDIKEPDIIPQCVIILDITEQNQLIQFSQSPEFISLIEQFQQKKKQIISFFHLSKDISSQEYIEFIQNYQNINHILCNYNPNQHQYKEENLKCINYQPISEQINNVLNQQYPNIFPNIKQLYLKELPKILQNQKNIFGYIPLFEYQILPYKQQDYKIIQNYNFKDINSLIKLTQNQQIMEQDHKQDYLKLIFLGTCSMIPGQYRNVTGMIIQNLRKNVNIILDCGEGTHKQIYDQNINLNEKPLLIWISHAHSDHHLGLLQILHNLRNQQQNSIFLLIPAVVLPWIQYFQQLLNIEFNCKIILIQQFDQLFQDDINKLVKNSFDKCRIRKGGEIQNNFNQDLQSNLLQLKEQLKDIFDLESIQVTQVEHCPEAYGLRLNFIDGRSLTYSGDTRPCKQFATLSLNTNILIHEATFTDDLQDNAEQNMHSTITEAIKIGQEANADVIALTHFSQRYSKKIELKQEQLENQKVVISCDHFGGYFNQYFSLSNVSKELSQIFHD